MCALSLSLALSLNLSLALSLGHSRSVSFCSTFSLSLYLSLSLSRAHARAHALTHAPPYAHIHVCCACSPTEPFCAAVRKITPPLFGVDISPVRSTHRNYVLRSKRPFRLLLTVCCRLTVLCWLRTVTDCALRDPEFHKGNLLGAAGCSHDDGGQMKVVMKLSYAFCILLLIFLCFVCI